MLSISVSLPRGDIEVLVGSDEFNIYCHLNPNYKYYTQNGARSRDLSFHILSARKGSVKTRLDSVILNETSIQATYDPKIVAKDRIECLVEVEGKSRAVCNQMVKVGYGVQPPENFTCISENWQSLNCTWDVPYNPIRTQYELFFMELGSGPR